MSLTPAPWLHLDAVGLLVRPMTPADIPAWYAYLADPRVIEHTSWSLQCAEDLLPLLHACQATHAEAPIRCAILRQQDQQLLGSIGFHTLSASNRSAELAYDLAYAHWGQGLASACCQALLDWGFTQRRWVRIQATVLDSNPASARVLEKCGLQREGLLHHYRLVRGTPRDYWMYARTCAENAGRSDPGSDVR